MVYRLLREEGLYVGGSTGINVCAAVETAKAARSRAHDRHAPLRSRLALLPAALQPSLARGEGPAGRMTATLVFQEETILPREFERRVACAASGLEALGVGDGDVVAILLRNSVEYLEAMFAARMLGAYFCPINWHFKSDEAGFILRDSGAKSSLLHPSFSKVPDSRFLPCGR
jgi:acyl-CoA synthetase (AMP-forming)/AMP-acid ligase II